MFGHRDRDDGLVDERHRNREHHRGQREVLRASPVLAVASAVPACAIRSPSLSRRRMPCLSRRGMIVRARPRCDRAARLCGTCGDLRRESLPSVQRRERNAALAGSTDIGGEGFTDMSASATPLGGRGGQHYRGRNGLDSIARRRDRHGDDRDGRGRGTGATDGRETARPAVAVPDDRGGRPGAVVRRPWAVLVYPLPHWPTPVTVAGTVVFVLALAAFPTLMFLGHGRGSATGPPRVGDTILGVIWVLFAWTVLGLFCGWCLAAGRRGRPDPLPDRRGRRSAGRRAGTGRLGLRRGDAGAAGPPGRGDAARGWAPGWTALRVVLLTDTHYGPIDRARWSAGWSTAVNALDADVVCHTGDIADGTAGRSGATRPPRSATSGPGWPASTSPATTSTSARPRAGSTGWRARLGAAAQPAPGGRARRRPAGAWPASTTSPPPASGLARPPRRPRRRAGRGRPRPARAAAGPPAQADRPAPSGPGSTCRSPGHTHGGQIWPFHLLVRIDQPVLHGLSRHGDRTQLYTSRGTGFWGPPFRVFAPSEITLLTLRCPTS